MNFSKEKYLQKKIYITNRIFIIIMLLLPVFLLVGVEVLHRGSIKEGIKWIIYNSNEAFFNYIIAFSLVNLMLFFSKRSLYFVLTSIIIFSMATLAQISYSKIDLRGEPLTILDFRLLGEAANIMGVLDIGYFIPLIIIIIGFILIVPIFIRFVRIEISNIFRFSIASVCLLLLVFGYSTNIGTLAKMKINIPADVSWNHNENGFMLATLVDSKFLKVPVPEDYEREQIEQVFQRMSDELENKKISNVEKPNVIFVMSESFWDISDNLNLSLSKDPIPNFHRIEKETLSGLIDVPGIGGGTANTEYEVLTGLSRRFLKEYSTPYNPYNAYIHRPIRSLATVFSEYGYSTTAMHTYHSWFYRRNEVYKHLGFERFIPLEGLLKKPKIDGLFASDSVVNELIINEVERTDEKDFIHFVTMQGHGPYKDMEIEKKSIKVNSDLSESSKTTVENYVNLLNKVDMNMNDLIQYFRDYDEPTILVYYGDHIPPLGNEVYEELGFNIYEKSGKRTNFFIWSNYSELTGNITLDANMLGAFVLNKLGIEDTFMNYLYSFYELSPHTEKNMKSREYKDFRLLQYDIMHGKQFIYDFVNKPIAHKTYTVGYPLKLERAVAEKFDNGYIIHLFGEGISWMSALNVSDNKMNLQIENHNKASFFMPKSEINKSEPLKMKLSIYDSREKIVKESNLLRYKDIDTLLVNNASYGTDAWERLRLDENLDWELFDSKSGYKVVRVNLNLEEVPYYVVNDRTILQDTDANQIDKENLSDIYSNGYLYLSISDQASGWGENVDQSSIRNYFKQNNYQLLLSK